eukprot:TRINITY_DN74275_c0_g1_i1.p1 TRINITY_DN74275_c0_g1~~TRINITY_DN74275_c0_g1_i1.p1  ORF type:complete len:884 (-),score=182.96 TRINITY_DN74275_c0_g1_i1:7-2658(-)
MAAPAKSNEEGGSMSTRPPPPPLPPIQPFPAKEAVAEVVAAALSRNRHDRKPKRHPPTVASIITTIPRADVERNILRQAHAVYVVQVLAFGMASEVRRTFEEFEALHARVARNAGESLPSLPPACWYWHERPEVVEERRASLESLLRDMLRQPGVVNDDEEHLLRFLDLPKAAAVAARFVVTPASSRNSWLPILLEATAEADSLAPLHDRSVDGALVDVLLRSLDDSGRVESSAKLEDIRIACELLARLFQSDGNACGAGCCDETADSCDATRANAVGALLAFVCCGRETSGAAGNALLVLSRSCRPCWSRILLKMLARDGVRRLADVACFSSDTSATSDVFEPPSNELSASWSKGDRLVAELLLRGCEMSVAQRLADKAENVQRRRLLNALYGSTDAFVKVAVGLLLAQFIRLESFRDAGEANAGLRGLCNDIALQPAEFRDADIALLLLEEDYWAWLCRLVSATQPWVSGFSLLVVALLVQPSPTRVMKTAGLFEELQSLLRVGVDPLVRGNAARILLSIAREEPSDGAIARTVAGLAGIGDAVSACVEARLAAERSEHAETAAASTNARQWCDAAASLGPLLEDCRGRAGSLHAEASAWSTSLAGAEASVAAAEEQRNLVQENWAEQRLQLTNVESTAAVERVNDDGLHANACNELRDLEASVVWRTEELTARERSFNETVEARVHLTEELAEHDEEARRYMAAVEAAGKAKNAMLERAQNESYVSRAGSFNDSESVDVLSSRLSDCKAKHVRSVKAMEAILSEAQEYDDHLRAISEPLPEARASLLADQSRISELMSQRAFVLKGWAQALEAQDVGSEHLKAANAILGFAGGALRAERSQRRHLRSAVHALVASLQDLDGELEALEVWNEREVLATVSR